MTSVLPGLREAIEAETHIYLSDDAMGRILRKLMVIPEQTTGTALEFLHSRARQARMMSKPTGTAAQHRLNRHVETSAQAYEAAAHLIAWLFASHRVTSAALAAYVEDWTDADGVPHDPPTLAEWRGMQDRVAELNKSLIDYKDELTKELSELTTRTREMTATRRDPNSDAERLACIRAWKELGRAIPAPPRLFEDGWRAALAQSPAWVPPDPSSEESRSRLSLALEGECEGLAITDEQARSILHFIGTGEPLPDDEPENVVGQSAVGFERLSPCMFHFEDMGGIGQCKGCGALWEAGAPQPDCGKAPVA